MDFIIQGLAFLDILFGIILLIMKFLLLLTRRCTSSMRRYVKIPRLFIFYEKI